MTRKNLLLSLLILSIASSILFTAHPTFATTYAPGVKSGDYVKYGTVSASFTSNVTGTPTPQFIKDLQATNYVRIDITSVSGTNATIKITQSFNNNTAPTTTVNWDVQSLTGNSTGGGNFFVLSTLPYLAAGGLTPSDKVCTGTGCSSPTPSFNSTQSRTYAGASRTDNVLNLSPTLGGGNSASINGYWDQSTGALMEISFSLTQQIPQFGSSPAQKNTYAFSMASTETSLWSANILGLAPIVFYGIIGAIVAVIAIVAVLMVMRMRKPKAPAMPGTTGTTPPPPPPGQ